MEYADLAAPRPRHRRPGAVMPAGATDCHLHVFGPEARYPWAERRAYTPPEAPLATYAGIAAQVGLQRAVLVQPTVYGTDNRALCDALRALGPARARGVAVIGADASPSALQALAQDGVRGVRLVTHPQAEPDAIARRIDSLAEMVSPLGWHVELLIGTAAIAVLEARLAALPVTLVFGHMGLPRAENGVAQAGFAALCRLLGHSRGHCWAKLSGAYRISRQAPGYEDSRPFASALYAAGPARVIWGTDWPHTGERADQTKGAAGRVGLRDVDIGLLLDLLAGSLPDATALQRVLVDNPTQLYGFDRGGQPAWT